MSWILTSELDKIICAAFKHMLLKSSWDFKLSLTFEQMFSLKIMRRRLQSGNFLAKSFCLFLLHLSKSSFVNFSFSQKLVGFWTWSKMVRPLISQPAYQSQSDERLQKLGAFDWNIFKVYSWNDFCTWGLFSSQQRLDYVAKSVNLFSNLIWESFLLIPIDSNAAAILCTLGGVDSSGLQVKP